MSTYKNIFDASSMGTVEDVRYFVEKGVYVNAIDDSGNTPLHEVMRHIYRAERESDCLAIAKYLVSKGAIIDWPNHHDNTPLFYVESLAFAEFLVSNGANVNAKSNVDGRTPLHWAADYTKDKEEEMQQLAIVKFLVSKKANVNAKDKEGVTPLDTAKGNKNKAIAKYLSEITLPARLLCIASLILGILSFFLWGVAIIGIVTSVIGMLKTKRLVRIAVVGLIFCIIGIGNRLLLAGYIF